MPSSATVRSSPKSHFYLKRSEVNVNDVPSGVWNQPGFFYVDSEKYVKCKLCKKYADNETHLTGSHHQRQVKYFDCLSEQKKVEQMKQWAKEFRLCNPGDENEDMLLQSVTHGALRNRQMPKSRSSSVINTVTNDDTNMNDAEFVIFKRNFESLARAQNAVDVKDKIRLIDNIIKDGIELPELQNFDDSVKKTLRKHYLKEQAQIESDRLEANRDQNMKLQVSNTRPTFLDSNALGNLPILGNRYAQELDQHSNHFENNVADFNSAASYSRDTLKVIDDHNTSICNQAIANFQHPLNSSEFHSFKSRLETMVHKQSIRIPESFDSSRALDNWKQIAAREFPYLTKVEDTGNVCITKRKSTPHDLIHWIYDVGAEGYLCHEDLAKQVQNWCREEGSKHPPNSTLRKQFNDMGSRVCVNNSDGNLDRRNIWQFSMYALYPDLRNLLIVMSQRSDDDNEGTETAESAADYGDLPDTTRCDTARSSTSGSQESPADKDTQSLRSKEDIGNDSADRSSADLIRNSANNKLQSNYESDKISNENRSGEEQGEEDDVSKYTRSSRGLFASDSVAQRQLQEDRELFEKFVRDINDKDCYRKFIENILDENQYKTYYGEGFGLYSGPSKSSSARQPPKLAREVKEWVDIHAYSLVDPKMIQERIQKFAKFNNYSSSYISSFFRTVRNVAEHTGKISMPRWVEKLKKEDQNRFWEVRETMIDFLCDYAVAKARDKSGAQILTKDYIKDARKVAAGELFYYYITTEFRLVIYDIRLVRRAWKLLDVSVHDVRGWRGQSALECAVQDLDVKKVKDILERYLEKTPIKNRGTKTEVTLQQVLNYKNQFGEDIRETIRSTFDESINSIQSSANILEIINLINPLI